MKNFDETSDDGDRNRAEKRIGINNYYNLCDWLTENYPWVIEEYNETRFMEKQNYVLDLFLVEYYPHIMFEWRFKNGE